METRNFQGFIAENVKKEDFFLDQIQPYCQCYIEKNNERDIYAIDFRIMEDPEVGPPLIVAWIDFEARDNNIWDFETIHVPLRDHDQEGERKKIEVYRNYPKRAYHLAWKFSIFRGILIRADAVLESPEVEITDKKTGRQLTCFDVPKRKTLIVTPEDLIPTILEWSRR